MAIAAQTHPPERVIVVDNASSDGTREMLAEEFPHVEVTSLPTNEGGAGGFHEAIRLGMASGAEWLWLMDDDTFPSSSALAELLAALERLEGLEAPALLASRVEWRDGRPHPMNRPTVRRREPGELADAVRHGLLPLRAATFVSLLVSREAVQRAGMPLRHFVWQTDDIEYTARILRHSRGYFVPRSVVEHRTAAKHTAIDDPRRFHYAARNTVLLLRGDALAPMEKPAVAWWLAHTVVDYLVANRLSVDSLKNVFGALFAGLRGPRSLLAHPNP